MESDEGPSANHVTANVQSSASPDHGVSDIQPLAPSDDDHCDHDHEQDHDLDQQAVVEPDHDDDHGKVQPCGSEDLLGDLLKKKIVKQVEYYFSEENLPNDKYMTALIKKNKDGFIPIPMIASFRKMKKLTKDNLLIVSALRQSTFLVVSSSGKKVRRLHPLPSTEVMNCDPKLCTVLVENLPEDHSEENIRKIFGEVGSIKKITIHDPHLVEKSAKGSKVDPLVRNKLHALVEYETVEATEKAVATLNQEEDWRNGMRVKLLKKLDQYGHRRQVWKGPDSEKSNAGRGSDLGEEEDIHSLSEHHDDTPEEEEGDRRNGQRGRNRGQARRQKYQGINGRGHGSGTTYSSHTSEIPKPPPGPKMPDGTRGFAIGRGRPLLSNQS